MGRVTTFSTKFFLWWIFVIFGLPRSSLSPYLGWRVGSQKKQEGGYFSPTQNLWLRRNNPMLPLMWQPCKGPTQICCFGNTNWLTALAADLLTHTVSMSHFLWATPRQRLTYISVDPFPPTGDSFKNTFGLRTPHRPGWYFLGTSLKPDTFLTHSFLLPLPQLISKLPYLYISLKTLPVYSGFLPLFLQRHFPHINLFTAYLILKVCLLEDLNKHISRSESWVVSWRCGNTWVFPHKTEFNNMENSWMRFIWQVQYNWIKVLLSVVCVLPNSTIPIISHLYQMGCHMTCLAHEYIWTWNF